MASSSNSKLYLSNLNTLLKSPNETQYKKQCLETGITKPTIFLGVHPERILGIPGCFGSDIMHLSTFNLTDLLVSLWCGILDHEKNDPPSNWLWAILYGETWEAHGRDLPLPLYSSLVHLISPLVTLLKGLTAVIRHRNGCFTFMD
jgi:hypothetical protein